MKKKVLFTIPVLALVPKAALAHCPLCTIGAGALAVLAASLGVSSVVVGVLIGAFALALSLWLAPMIKKQYIPYQKEVLTILIFLGTVIPIMPLIRDYGPLYLSLGGEYGTLLHNTYTINLFILGVVIGSIVMLVAPYLSKLVTKVRGKQTPYQGISITLLLLVIVSILSQLMS
jgi:hypothetical protein